MQTQEEFMNLDRENMRKIRQLILFTIIILIALWNYAIILDAVGYALGIIFPFILGGGIAFVLNVPMSSIEELIFYNKKLKDKKIANRLARPVSLVLTIVIMIGVVVLVMFVVIPELTRTLMSLGRTIQVFIPTDLTDSYKHYIETFFGPGACHIASIRQAGAVCLYREET